MTAPIETVALSLREVAFEHYEEFFNSVVEQAALTPEQQSQLGEQLKSSIEKRDKLGNFLALLDSEAEKIRAKEKQLAERRRRLEKFSEIIQSSLHSQMVDWGVKKVEGQEYTFAIRQNPPKVVIDDEERIPAEYVNYVPTIDKARIKDDLTEGKQVEGAHLEQGTRLDIR